MGGLNFKLTCRSFLCILFMSFLFVMCVANISDYEVCLLTLLMVILEKNFLILILSNFINIFF